MHPARRFERWKVLAAALLACAAGCRSADPRSRIETLRASGAPSLEEIFLLPGIQGRAPRAEEFTADGRWVFFHFNPLEVASDGARKIQKEHSLRIQSTQAPEATAFEGLRLDDVLPAAGDATVSQPALEPVLALSHHGARVLARRDKELFLLDAPESPRGKWSVRVLLRAETGGALQQLGSARFNADDSAVLVEADKDLWLFPLRAAATPATPLTEADGTNLTAAIEADARLLTFSRDLDVVFGRDPAPATIEIPATESTPASVTKAQILWRASGKAVALAGMAEVKALDDASLSPDGRFLFASVADRTNDPAPTLIPDFLSPRVSTREGRGALADDRPAPRKLYVWNTATGERAELAPATDERFFLRTIGWAGEGPPRLALACLSEDFRTQETFVWSEAKGLSKLFVDRDERWIGGPVGGARWTSDGSRLVFGSESFPASTLPGRAQLFACDVASGNVSQLTLVSGEVSSFDLARDGGIAFSYCDALAREQRKLGYIDPAGHVEDLDAPSGWDVDPNLASDARVIVFRHSRLFQPAELWSVAAGTRSPARELTRTAPPDFARRRFVRPESLAVPGERDATIHSHVFLPRSSTLASPDRPRACIVFIHGAGYLQNVTDSMTEYEPNLLFHSRLADLGYAVVDVDYRGSEGYGQDFRTAVQGHLGGLELADIDATLDELARRGVIDRARVACYGGSYGGFLTLMALFTEGERWTAGAALRSVSDWRTYAPGYTQPRLGRPSKDPEAYARSSPIDHADGLTKPLLLLHGMMDTNVFAQDTIRLMEKLIELGKEFEVMLYPSQDHAFTNGAHWLDEYKRIERFLMDHLGPP